MTLKYERVKLDSNNEYSLKFILGAFLIPYFICLLLFGIPLFFLETAAGQFSGQGLLHVWEVCPIFKGMTNIILFLYFKHEINK